MSGRRLLSLCNGCRLAQVFGEGKQALGRKLVLMDDDLQWTDHAGEPATYRDKPATFDFIAHYMQ